MLLYLILEHRLECLIILIRLNRATLQCQVAYEGRNGYYVLKWNI